MPRRSVLFVASILLVVTAACSSSSKSSASSTSTTSTTEKVKIVTTTTAAVPVPDGFTAGDKTAFCAAWKDVKDRSYVDNGSDPQKIKDHYTQVGEAARRLLAASSNEIRAAVETAVKVNDEVVAQGSLDPLKPADVQKNGAVIAGYATKYCGK